MNNCGKLIVIEGGDGSGKSTQTPLLCERLIKSGKNVFDISFPRYDLPTGFTVKQYLNGDFGGVDESGAFSASAIYAVDRFVSYKTEEWGKRLNSGETVIATRYTTSNMIYQTARLDKEKWDDYIEWLEDFEYEKMGIPKPDLTVYLDMPCEVSQKLLSQRYCGDESKKDIHEKDIGFALKCRETALFAADKCGWKILKCNNGDLPRSIEEINDELFNTVIKSL